MANLKIVQIIPADGWFAVLKQDDGSNKNYPLVCWALVKDEDGDTSVQGMDAADDVDFVEPMKSFQHYIHASEIKP